MDRYFGPTPNSTDAYYTDGTHKWFAKAAKGVLTSKAGWQIFKMEYTGANWIIKYPVDSTTGVGSDAPKFIADNWNSYTYNILGT